jgi:hypothetical protein
MRNETIKDALGGKIKFHEELDRIDKEKLIAGKFILRDATIVSDWDSQYGTSSFALLMVQLEDGKSYTTLTGGVAIVRQVQKLLKRGKLPGRIDCTLNSVESENGRNYYVLDWPEDWTPIVIKDAAKVDSGAELFPEDKPVVKAAA